MEAENREFNRDNYRKSTIIIKYITEWSKVLYRIN